MSVWGDIAGLFGFDSNSATAQAEKNAAGSGEAFTAFFAEISDASMWKSLGWIAMGAILMIVGLILWLKKDGYVPKAAPVPVPV